MRATPRQGGRADETAIHPRVVLWQAARAEMWIAHAAAGLSDGGGETSGPQEQIRQVQPMGTTGDHTRSRHTTRRDFLAMAAKLSVLAAAAAALRLGIRFLRPVVSYGPPALIRVGFPSDYITGGRRLLQRERVLIVREEQGFRALSAVCTHLGCTITLMEWGFSCPCHGSRFDWNGVNFAGPAPRPLDNFQISLAPDGSLAVDTLRTLPRDFYFNPFTAGEAG